MTLFENNNTGGIMTRKRIWYLTFSLSLICVLIFSYNIIDYAYKSKEELKILSEIKNTSIDKLKLMNNDIVGYIIVNDTNINYPIVKGKDNNYYLNHSFLKKESKRGSIFLDYRNDLNNLSRNNIIYGHGLTDNTMFGSLNNLLKKEWYNNKNNLYIKIITDNSIKIFQIFSVYTINKESYYIKTYFSNNKYFKQFLKTITRRSIFNFNSDVDVNDKILTLSTCKNDFGSRIVVHSKLLSEKKIEL